MQKYGLSFSEFYREHDITPASDGAYYLAEDVDRCIRWIIDHQAHVFEDGNGSLILGWEPLAGEEHLCVGFALRDSSIAALVDAIFHVTTGDK